MMRVASKLQCIHKVNPRFATVRYISQLFVSRLSFYTTDDQLERLFSPFGRVKEARLVMDFQTGRTKGFGFVTFENKTDAQNAVKALNGRNENYFGFVTFEDETDAQNAVKALNGRIVQGRLIFVEFASESKD